MTTIAYRDGKMAADRMVKCGAVAHHDITKIVRRMDGALCGTCGVSSLGFAFRKWFLGGEVGDKPSCGDSEDCNIHAIIVRPSGVVELHDFLGMSEIEGPFHAVGAGAEFALGAMAMGADAVQAVNIAAEFGVGRVGYVDCITHRQMAVAAE